MQHNIHGGDVYSDLVEYDFSVNTNPLDCTEIHKAIVRRIEDKLGNYPDLEQREFRAAVADIENVSIENVWGSNGASEAFSAIISMLKSRKTLLLEPCFLGYRHALSMREGCTVDSYRLNDKNDFSVGIDFIEILQKRAKEGLDLLIIANPNNPTGKSVDIKVLCDILKICKSNNVKMIVDECFLRMCDGAKSMVEFIDDYDGLFVVNAFTKLFSIPGLRVGYTISNKNNILELKKYLSEWNMSVPAQESGIICRDYLKQNAWEENTKKLLRREREYLTNELISHGYKAWDSDTNFILFYSTKKELKERLLQRRILIRDCSNYTGLSEGYYRIAVKDHKQNEILIDAIRSL